MRQVRKIEETGRHGGGSRHTLACHASRPRVIGAFRSQDSVGAPLPAALPRRPQRNLPPLFLDARGECHPPRCSLACYPLYRARDINRDPLSLSFPLAHKRQRPRGDAPTAWPLLRRFSCSLCACYVERRADERVYTRTLHARKLTITAECHRVTNPNLKTGPKRDSPYPRPQLIKTID